MCLLILYTITLILLGLFILPKYLWQHFKYGKYKGSLLHRFGFILPASSNSNDPIYWIHAVSLGEAKASISLIKKIKAREPKSQIFFSTITKTGYQEAEKIPDVDIVFYLPLDFPWVMKKLVKRLSPDIFILVETDFWLNLLREIKKRGGKVFLVNGKMSVRSLKRFKRFPFYAKKLFNVFDHLCVQNDLYRNRFLECGISPEKITSTGNLKFDNLPMISTPIFPSKSLITIGSTHAGEEKKILKALKPLDVQIALAPRHPERFDDIYFSLLKDGFEIKRFSEHKDFLSPVVLIDQMGMLNALYAHSKLALIGGSFIPGIGGHNVFEPLFFGIPCLFGPYMENQSQLVELVLSYGAGKQVSFENLYKEIKQLLNNPTLYETMSKNALKLSQECQGALSRTLDAILPDFSFTI